MKYIPGILQVYKTVQLLYVCLGKKTDINLRGIVKTVSDLLMIGWFKMLSFFASRQKGTYRLEQIVN